MEAAQGRMGGATGGDEDQFRLLLESFRDSAVFRLDPEGHVSTWDENAERLLGHGAIEILGRPHDRFYVEEDLERARPRADLDAALAHGTAEFEAWRMRADGSLLWAGVVISPIRDGEAVTGFSCAIRDITQRKQAEEELRETEEGFRLLIEGVKDYAIFILDADGRVASWNPGAERMKGWTAEEVIGRPHAIFYPSHERASGRPGDDLRTALRDGRQESEGWRLRRDGSRFWASVALAPLYEGDRLRGFSSVTRDMTERKRYEAELAHRALHDPLTGLANRELLMDRAQQALARAAREGTLVGVLFVDLDRFKLVNDSLGHGVGDQLLCQVAERLAECIRAGDTVARLGGDEFVVLCESLVDRAEAVAVARRALAALTKPIAVGGSELATSASIGVAADVGITAAELLRDADAAMYAVKTAGGGRFGTFDPETMRSSASERLAGERDLRQALREGQLRVVYQPQIRIATRAVEGVEALVRWHHPQRGSIPPGDFIPLAEETGLIADIGEHVLHEACREVRAWPGVKVAVNFSPAQLLTHDPVALVRAALGETKTRPDCLCLEITEGVLMADAPASVAILTDLADLGVAVAIDDFGTGWSSLSYLRRFPVGSLKIDASFVQGLGERRSDDAIVAAMLGMADALELSVVAEGVENERQLDTLRKLGCPLGQGFLLGRPSNPQDITRLVGARA